MDYSYFVNDNTMDDIIHSGVLLRDYVPEYLVRAGSMPTIPKPLSRFEDRKIQFNQNSFDKSWCTYTADMTIVANNWNKDRTQEDIQWFIDNKKNYWRTGAGMYMDRAVDMVCDRLNMLYPEEQWRGMLIDFYTERDKYLKDGHMLMIGSMINDKYIQEVQDGKIDAPWWKTGIWHVRSIFSHTAYKGEALVENFLGVLPFNVIDLVALQEIENNKQMFHTTFLLYPSGQMPIEITVPYMSEAEASAIENSNPQLYEWLTELVRTWVLYAGQGMKLQAQNYRGLVGTNKMYNDIQDYRNWVNQE